MKNIYNHKLLLLLKPSNPPASNPSINHTNLSNDHRDPNYHTNDYRDPIVLGEFPSTDLDAFLLQDVFPKETGEGGGESV
jgi:hypothetical protein